MGSVDSGSNGVGMTSGDLSLTRVSLIFRTDPTNVVAPGNTFWTSRFDLDFSN